ncbi:hypothetical protein HC248_01403 [Polaromonas vacuolata]|uniref:Uncharacterized protein n=1 Tax=Polaromonas vacuolata TaxID=37448 RepID=A0A6H2H8L7_9BURK|nr:hypothetical protein HC248_01403 [Polaromonas vacuolata]
MSMTKIGTAGIKCPKCGGNQFLQGNTPEMEDQISCISCGNFFSLQLEIDKMAKAFKIRTAEILGKELD